MVYSFQSWDVDLAVPSVTWRAPPWSCTWAIAEVLMWLWCAGPGQIYSFELCQHWGRNMSPDLKMGEKVIGWEIPLFEHSGRGRIGCTWLYQPSKKRMNMAVRLRGEKYSVSRRERESSLRRKKSEVSVKRNKGKEQASVTQWPLCIKNKTQILISRGKLRK